MLNIAMKYLKKPELIVESNPKLWDDDHISKGMLEAHLCPQHDGASRPPVFMDQSVEWINQVAPSEANPNLLDLGCGPGLYGERLAEKGYTVTGVDFSKRSIEYARQQAKEKGLKNKYICKNYLEIDYDNEFDVIILISCDYGVLSVTEREILLQKIYRALKKGGKLIFDVLTPQQYVGKQESKRWYLDEGGGFFKPHTYLCLEAHYIYEGNIRLDQHIIVDEAGKVDVFNVWDHYFTKETIEEEVKSVAFTNIQIFSDVAGKAYDEASKTMGIVIEK